MFNKLLEQQIQKHFGDEKNSSPELLMFFSAVSDAYDHYEKDRSVLIRTMELNAAELIAANKKIKEEIVENELVFNKLRKSLLVEWNPKLVRVQNSILLTPKKII